MKISPEKLGKKVLIAYFENEYKYFLFMRMGVERFHYYCYCHLFFHGKAIFNNVMFAVGYTVFHLHSVSVVTGTITGYFEHTMC